MSPMPSFKKRPGGLGVMVPQSDAQGLHIPASEHQDANSDSKLHPKGPRTGSHGRNGGSTPQQLQQNGPGSTGLPPKGAKVSPEESKSLPEESKGLPPGERRSPQWDSKPFPGLPRSAPRGSKGLLPKGAKAPPRLAKVSPQGSKGGVGRPPMTSSRYNFPLRGFPIFIFAKRPPAALIHRQ